MKEYLKKLFWGGYSKETYLKFKESLDNRCYKALFNMCLIYIAMFLTLFVIYAAVHKTTVTTLFVYLIGVITFLILSIILNNGSQHASYSDRTLWITILAAFIFSTYCTLHTNCGPAAIALFFSVLPIILPVPIFEIGTMNFVMMAVVTLSDLKIYGLAKMVDDVPIYIVGFVIGIFIGIRIGGLRSGLDAIIKGSVDALTNIYNRGALNAVYNKKVCNNKNFGLAMFDTDNFKKYNDNYGHEKGDEILQKIAEALFRVSERHNGQIFRYGGDEFCAIFDVSSEKELRDAMLDCLSEIRNIRIEVPTADGDCSLAGVTVSAGYAFGKNEIRTRADRALQEAKNSGKDRMIAASK